MRNIQGMVITLIARSSLAGVGLKFVVRESSRGNYTLTGS